MKSNHVFPIPFPIPLAGLALAELMEGTVSTSPMPEVRQVIFNPPATIVHWSDGTKTVARCNEQDTFSEEVGLAMACAKKLLHPYESFQECLDKAIRPKKTAKTPVTEAASPKVKAASKKPMTTAPAEPGKPTQPRRIGLDELLRLFVNDAPAGKIEATIVLG